MSQTKCSRSNNFKAHFLSILAGTTEDFPLQLWDKWLPQAEITVNLLRQSNATPDISAYAHMNGPFDYNKMPLAPLRCNVQVHEKADKRGTWKVCPNITRALSNTQMLHQSHQKRTTQ
eukprot:scaffold204570_cov36-Cyclotella_meneghiniana.AAC.1